jgi:hypothetical protein
MAMDAHYLQLAAITRLLITLGGGATPSGNSVQLRGALHKQVNLLQLDWRFYIATVIMLLSHLPLACKSWCTPPFIPQVVRIENRLRGESDIKHLEVRQHLS